MDINTLQSFLECPICNYIPRNMKISICQNGHEICEDCHGRLDAGQRTFKVCPQGNCGYNEQDNGEPVRSRKSEEMVQNANVQFNCCNVRSGCLVVMEVGDLRKHEEGCSFRPVRCPLCKKKETYEMFENHMTQDHKVEKSDDEIVPGAGFFQAFNVEHEEMQGDSHWVWKGMQFTLPSGEKFYSTLDRVNGVWYFGLHSTDAKEWKVSIKAEGEGSEYGVKFQCPVNPIDSSANGLSETGNCLALLDKTVEKITKGCSVALDLWFKIKKHS